MPFGISQMSSFVGWARVDNQASKKAADLFVYNVRFLPAILKVHALSNVPFRCLL